MNGTSSTVTVTAADAEIDVSGHATVVKPPTRKQRLKDKLHAWVYALVERFDDRKSPGANESRFVRNGKAAVKVTLTTVSPEVLEKLRTSGFEITSETVNVLTGRIAIEKLKALAEIDEVKLIIPAT
jgi:hypothetical protein